MFRKWPFRDSFSLLLSKVLRKCTEQERNQQEKCMSELGGPVWQIPFGLIYVKVHHIHNHEVRNNSTDADNVNVCCDLFLILSFKVSNKHL